MSLLRLATNAARRSWKVIFFDALGTETQAATFLAAMQQAGRQQIHSFPQEPYAGWNGTPQQILERLLQVAAPGEPYYQQINTLCLSTCLAGAQPSHLDELVRRLVDVLQPKRSVFSQLSPILRMVRPADLAGVPLRYGALARLIGNSLDGGWSYEHAEAAYFSFNAWSRPEQARALARFLLADLASYLSERTAGAPHVLLLIKHPNLLFDLQQIAPLFAYMERMGGSVFVTVRSVADLGSQASRILSNAPTLLIHRSSTAAHFDPYVSVPWWSTRAISDGTVRQLPDDECVVIHRGEDSCVRLDPVVVETAEVLRAQAHIHLSKPLAGPIWGESSGDPFAPYRAPFEPFDLSDLPDLALPDEVDSMMVVGTPIEESTHQRQGGASKARTRRVRSKRSSKQTTGQAKIE